MDSLLLPCLGTQFLAGGLGCGKFGFFFPRSDEVQWADRLNRYNTFYVFYPIGISSECALIFQALGPAGELNPLFRYLLIAILVIYVPGMLFFFMGMFVLSVTNYLLGSYILYTHMIAQRRKVMRGKKRAD